MTDIRFQCKKCGNEEVLLDRDIKTPISVIKGLLAKFGVSGDKFSVAMRKDGKKNWEELL